MILRQAVIGDIEAISHIESLCFPKAEAATYEQFKERFNAFSENFLVLEDKDVIGFINGIHRILKAYQMRSMKMLHYMILVVII